MKLCAHGLNRRTSGPRAQIMRKWIFYGRIAIFMKLGAHGPNRRTTGSRAQIMTKRIFSAVLEFRSWENQFLRPNRNFHEMGSHGPNRRTSRPRAQIMRKSIFTAELHFSGNWVSTAQIGTQEVTELRSWENQLLRPNRNFHEIGCSRPKLAQ